MFKKKKKQDNNFLRYIPIKNHSNWQLKDNVIYLVFRYDKPIERLAAWLTGKPTVRDIKLDKLSTRVWQLIDGCNSVYSIGQILTKEFGEDCQPVYERLIMYLRHLSRRGWIKYTLDKKNINITADI